MIALNKDEIDVTLKNLKLSAGALNSHVENLDGVPVVFSNTTNVSTDPNTVSRTIGVTYKDQTTQLTVVLAKAANAVNVKIIPLNHPTLSVPLEFAIDDPTGAPPAPDFTFSAGWFGWAGSLSETEVKQILDAANSAAGTAVRAAITAIVGHFNFIAGVIVGFVLAIGPILLKFLDDRGRNTGVCFVDTWPGIWWCQANPVPWGF
jgi:hypothetical protein